MSLSTLNSLAQVCEIAGSAPRLKAVKSVTDRSAKLNTGPDRVHGVKELEHAPDLLGGAPACAVDGKGTGQDATRR